MSSSQRVVVTIDDCRVDTFTVGGHGGAGKDTSNTGVRITHPPSGAVGVATDTRSQAKNKQLAFNRMGRNDAFSKWVRVEMARLASGKTVDEVVDEQMRPQNLHIEVRGGDGRWTRETP